jgi:oxalate decarboxylase
MSEENGQSKLTRRRFLETGSAVLVAAAGLQAEGQQSRIYPTDTHTGVNESQPGPKK